MAGTIAQMAGGLFGSSRRPAPEKPRQNNMRRIAGIAGDVLLGLAGQQGQYGPMMAQQRAQEQRMQQQMQMAQQARQWGNEDWQARQEWERANPDPATPGSFEWYQTATPEQRAMYDQYNPFVVATGNGPVAVPRDRPRVGSTVSMSDLGGPSGAASGEQRPTLTVSPQELNALIQSGRMTPARANEAMASGSLIVRGN